MQRLIASDFIVVTELSLDCFFTDTAAAERVSESEEKGLGRFMSKVILSMLTRVGEPGRTIG
jgi:hypothetical protein